MDGFHQIQPFFQLFFITTPFLQKRLAWALFVLLFSTLMCCQPTELIWAFLFHKFSNFIPPPPPGWEVVFLITSLGGLHSGLKGLIKYFPILLRPAVLEVWSLRSSMAEPTPSLFSLKVGRFIKLSHWRDGWFYF